MDYIRTLEMPEELMARLGKEPELVDRVVLRPGQIVQVADTGVRWKDDPLAPPEQVADFENEMRAGGVKDWQVMAYGIVPQILPVIIGTIIFEWDINIRRSAIANSRASMSWPSRAMRAAASRAT